VEKKKYAFRIGVLITVILFPISVLSENPDHEYAVQRSFFSAMSAGLGGAGTAIPYGIANGFINPALVYSYRSDVDKVHGTVMAGYGRDSIFDRHIAPFGANYSNPDGALGIFYRPMVSGTFGDVQEWILNLSGRLFDNATQQGPVDFGLNIRFDDYDWTTPTMPMLRDRKIIFDSTGQAIDTLFIGDRTSANTEGMIRDRRLIFDVGFFQSDVAPNLDFSLTSLNLAGYRITQEKPDVEVTYDTIGDTILQDISYGDDEIKNQGWIKSPHRTITVGMAYHIDLTNNALRFSFPFDVEVLGLFESNVKTAFTLYSGVQVRVKDMVFLRFGYARAPGSIVANAEKLPLKNFFSGGAGVSIDPVTFDFFITEDRWGVNGQFDW